MQSGENTVHAQEAKVTEGMDEKIQNGQRILRIFREENRERTINKVFKEENYVT